VDVVTGAFSFTGRYIAARLLEQSREVRTLTRRPLSESPFGDRIEAFPPDSDPAPLRGVDTLYNTYWIRFPDRGTTFADAVRRSVALFEAAQAAGVRRVVQLSVANADPDSPYAYFRGKAAVDSALAASGLSYAVVRPTLVFGDGEILLNNVAWILRRFPLFLLPGAGCRIQPIAAQDVADLCVEVGAGDENVVLDAAGPDVFAFEELVRLIRDAVGSRAAVARGGPRTALALTRLLGAITHQTVLTRDELGALRNDLLTSTEPPRGQRRLADWLGTRGHKLGAVFASGERRPWG
jgi:NADH dehydrogenase